MKKARSYYPVLRVMLITFISAFIVHDLSAAPKIVCKDPEYRFGAAAAWQTVDHSFSIANDGDQPLQIGAIRACCGATVTMPEKNILPGSNSLMKVLLSLNGKNGECHKSIYVGSNDPTQPYLQIRFVGTAVSAIRAEPGAVAFGVVASNLCTTSTVDLVCVSNENIRVTNIVSSSSCFAVTANTSGEPPWHLSVASVPPLPLGVSQGAIVISTDHPKYPKIEVPVSAIVGSDLVTVPDEISFKAGTTKAFSRYLAIKSRTNKPFKIVEIKSPEDGMKVSFQPVSSGGYKIEIKDILPFADLDGKSLEIVTDHPEAKTMSIPFKLGQRMKPEN